MFRYAFELAGAGSRPRVCLIATAGGDQPATIGAFRSDEELDEFLRYIQAARRSDLG